MFCCQCKTIVWNVAFLYCMNCLLSPLFTQCKCTLIIYIKKPNPWKYWIAAISTKHKYKFKFQFKVILSKYCSTQHITASAELPRFIEGITVHSGVMSLHCTMHSVYRTDVQSVYIMAFKYCCFYYALSKWLSQITVLNYFSKHRLRVTINTPPVQSGFICVEL